MTSPIRIAVFGNGFSRKVMLPCLRHVEGIELVGIASPNQHKAGETAQEFGIGEVSADHRTILETTKPDLVLVTTPPHRHREQAVDSLRSGAHVICEKPTAMSAAESREMQDVAASMPDRISLIDHELRFDPRRQKIRDLIESHQLGDIWHATYSIDSPGRNDPSTPWTWWSDIDQGGGTLGALGSHAIDSLRSFLGEITAVKGTLDTFIKERIDPSTGKPRRVTSDDYAAAWIRFESGTIANMRLSLVEPERSHRFTLAGSKGAVHFTEQAPLRAALTIGNPLEELPIADELPDSASLGIPDSDWARNFLRLARETVKAIRSGSTEVPGAATFVDGHRNQLVIDAIRRSHDTDDWVEVKS